MIKVTISTLTAVREELPSYLTRDVYTLQNLQSIAKPVPDYLFDIEYWPEVDKTPSYDDRTHVLGDETLTVDAGTKTVNVVKKRVKRPIAEINQHCQRIIRAKMNQVLAQDIDIGGGTISSLEELRENQDLLDGSVASAINFKSGHRNVTKAQQTVIKNKMKGHHRASHNRAHAILELIKAESTGTAKIAVLDTQADQGWP